MTTPVAPPASYPGTIKQFTTKEDGEVIYGAHANEWQNEIVGIQTTLGRNPQTPALALPTLPPTPNTVSDRIGNIESSAVWTAGNQTIAGNKEFTSLLTASGGELVKGQFEHRPAATGYKVVGDASGWQGRDTVSGAVADLPLQPNGGMLRRAGNLVWDAGNDGPGSGLDADTLDGMHASAFLVAAGVEAISTRSQVINNGDNPWFNATGWQDLALDTVTYADNDFGVLYPGDGWFHIPYTGIYLVTVAITWDHGGGGTSWSGWRGIHVRDDSGLWVAHVANEVKTIAMYTSFCPQDLTRARFLRAGTKIKASVWQNSGVPLSIVTTTSPPPPNTIAVAYPTGMTVTRVL